MQDPVTAPRLDVRSGLGEAWMDEWMNERTNDFVWIMLFFSTGVGIGTLAFAEVD